MKPRAREQVKCVHPRRIQAITDRRPVPASARLRRRGRQLIYRIIFGIFIIVGTANTFVRDVQSTVSDTLSQT